MINLAQILTLDKSRLQRRVGALPPEAMDKVDAAIRISLNLA
jgi:mRNA-degrading endonuclease toxin of MazEF toxin-antitoxin module